MVGRGIAALALALCAGAPSAQALGTPRLLPLALAQDGDDDAPPPPKKSHKKRKPKPWEDVDLGDDAPPPKKSGPPRGNGDEDAAPPPKKPRPPPSDDDEEAPKKHKSSDDDDADAKKSSDDEPSSDDAVVHAGWGAVAGHGPNGQMFLGEVGLPGVRGLYLVSRNDTFAYGGGGGIDFPPLSFSGHSPRGFNALRFIGRLDYYVPTDAVQLYVRFEPQWIAAIGDASIGGIFYMPVEGGAGFDLSSVHLAASLGFGAQFTGSSLLLPFTDFIFASPFLGASGELPLSDSLAITARLRLQTYAWDAPPPGSSTVDRAPTLIGLGYAMVGAAYRF